MVIILVYLSGRSRRATAPIFFLYGRLCLGLTSHRHGRPKQRMGLNYCATLHAIWLR